MRRVVLRVPADLYHVAIGIQDLERDVVRLVPPLDLGYPQTALPNVRRWAAAEQRELDTVGGADDESVGLLPRRALEAQGVPVELERATRIAYSQANVVRHSHRDMLLA